MKNKIFIALSIVFLAGCTYYKTVSISEISEKSITIITKHKPNVALSAIGSTSVYILKDFNIENDTLKGILVPSELTNYNFEKKVFRKKHVPDALNYSYFRTSSPMVEGPLQLPLSDIVSGKIIEKDYHTTVLSYTAGTAAVGAGIFGIGQAMCGCPHVAVINPDGTTSSQGSLFPGSMFKMLKRSDHLVLHDYQKSDSGILSVKVYNDLEEIQFIDHIELLGIEHNFDYFGIDNESKLIGYNSGETPIHATTTNGTDVLGIISQRDDVNYEFDEISSADQLNSVELTFNTSSLESNAQLIIRGQQSKWLEYTAEHFFQQMGGSFPKWVSKMNEGDSLKYANNAIEQGISMNAYVKIKGEWTYFGSYENVGTVAPRDISLPINLEGLGEEVEIKLECAHAFWSLDHIALTSDWSTRLKTSSFPLVSALNEKGEDVAETVIKVDDSYVTHEKRGTYTNLSFEVPENFKGSLVLQSSGYYNQIREYSHKANKKILKDLKATDLSTHKLSRSLSLQLHLQASSK